MNESTAHDRALLPWQRGVHVYNVPMFSVPFLIFLTITVIGLGLSIVRAFGGLAFTGMSDAYAWGIWKTFNVMTLTALGSGGFAIGIAAWVFNWHELHRVMRTALLTSLVFYFAGLLALTVDVGRPWNLWHVLFPKSLEHRIILARSRNMHAVVCDDLPVVRELPTDLGTYLRSRIGPGSSADAAAASTVSLRLPVRDRGCVRLACDAPVIARSAAAIGWTKAPSAVADPDAPAPLRHTGGRRGGRVRHHHAARRVPRMADEGSTQK